MNKDELAEALEKLLKPKAKPKKKVDWIGLAAIAWVAFLVVLLFARR